MKRTKSKKKLLLILGCAVLILILGTVIGVAVKKNHDEAVREQTDRELVEARVRPIAETFCIWDLKLDRIEDSDWKNDCVFISEDFANLSDEDKLLFLVACSADLDDRDTFPLESDRYGNYIEVIVECDSAKYWTGIFTDGESCLMRNQAKVLSMPTDHAKEISAEIEKEVQAWRAQNGYPQTTGNTRCSLCNGSGYVKYNYGSSDLEALLDGEAPYIVGPCPSCHGTGWKD